MNPEIKAKVNEILKANGKRELSLDEMDEMTGKMLDACGKYHSFW